MFGIINFTGFIVASILIIVAPGPGTLYIFSSAGGKGRFQGFMAMLGVMTGDLMRKSKIILVVYQCHLKVRPIFSIKISAWSIVRLLDFFLLLQQFLIFRNFFYQFRGKSSIWKSFSCRGSN